MKNLCALLLVLILTLPIFAGQKTYDFENLAENAGFLYLPLGSSVRISYHGDMVWAENSGYAPFGSRSLPGRFSTTSIPYVINFVDRPATSFSLDFGDADRDTDTLVLRAYSDFYGQGKLIAEVSDVLPGNARFTAKRLMVEGAGIRSVTFIGGSPEKRNSVFYDNFRATTVPLRASFTESFYPYSDYAVYRPQDNALYALRFAFDPAYKNFQTGEGKPVIGDYDGDNLSDVAVFNNGIWAIQLSATDQTQSTHFGQAGDIPLSADFDGDGITDVAVFRPSNGFWYMLRSSDGKFSATRFGQEGDIPVPAHYDTDGRADAAVFRPSDGTWYILGSKDGFRAERFGLGTDKPVPADYDGDGITDIAVFRDGVWYLLKSKEGFEAVQFGLPTDIPVPNNYLTAPTVGVFENKDDIAVFREGVWYVRTPTGFIARQWGQAGDVPISLAP